MPDQSGGNGGGADTIELTNHSATACTMFGFPGLGLLDPSGASQALVVQRAHGALGIEPAVAPATVILMPGAVASFWVSWGAAGGSTQGILQITPPNQTTQLLLGDPGVPLNVGTVWVSAVMAGVIIPEPQPPAPNVAIDGPYADLFWTVSPAHPFTSLQVPMAIVQIPTPGPSQVAPAEFWSTQFQPVGSCGCPNGNQGYFGLQDDQSGERVLFSWWSAIRGSSTNPEATVANFSGEGTGIQIKLPFEIAQGRGYQLRLSRTQVGPQATTWQAVILDTTTQTQTVIGAIAVPNAWGTSLGGSTTSFTEYYGPAVNDCARLPAAAVQFGPITMNGGLPSSGPYFHHAGTGANGCPAQQSSTGPASYLEQVGSPA